MTDGRDVILELIRAYGHLQTELNVTYYNQDSDEIHRLEELVDRLEAEAGIEWVDGAPRWKAADTVTLLEDVLAKHPDGEEIARVVTGNLARAAARYAKALEPVPAPKPAQFLDGCRKVDGTFIHGRPHSCPKWARG